MDIKPDFITFASGSSGNCYYFGNSESGFLIDAGISARSLKKRLGEFNRDISSIKFILVTHAHIDHIKHLPSISEKFSIPVYTSEKVHKAIVFNPFFPQSKISGRRVLEKNQTFDAGFVNITPFVIPHDADENLGYYLEFGDYRITVMTDLGEVTESAIDYCKKSQSVVIESNYDDQMLIKGGYPDYLKRRILGGNGHLSNLSASEAIIKFYHSGLKNIFLCHLSSNNNTPEAAFEASALRLREIGIEPGEKINLHCLPRREHRFFEL